MMEELIFRAALFDLDGVVFDTEGQYTVFWGEQCRLYHPDKPGLELKIKGQTLVQIFNRYFAGLESEQQKIIERLDAFERTMCFNYVDGFETFINELRGKGVKTAVVTSSNRMKMRAVYEARPEFKPLFDAILTSEDFKRSKPDPDCYLKGAETFGLKPSQCVVFEDSFNGLRSGRTAGMTVVGLATTNDAEAITPYSDFVIDNFCRLGYDEVQRVMRDKR